MRREIIGVNVRVNKKNGRINVSKTVLTAMATVALYRRDDEYSVKFTISCRNQRNEPERVNWSRRSKN